MAGSIALSLTQRYDKTSHEPLDGGKLYFYAAGTTTPQNAYQDVSLTIPWPNYLTLDSGGNVPQLFFDDGYIKFRLTNADGVTQIEADYVLVLGPTAGSGAAPSVDATTIFSTGDVKPRYGTGAHTGWVRANGRTIGSASSGATERANSDTQTLFEYLWTTDANLSVSAGRGASANADWVANKNIALPDFRGRVPAGLDDMGNTSAARLTLLSSTTLGASGGAQSVYLTLAQIPTGITSVNAAQAISVTADGTGRHVPTSSGSWFPFTANDGATRATAYAPSGASDTTAFSGSNSISVTSNNTLGSDHANVQPAILITYYVKL